MQPFAVAFIPKPVLHVNAVELQVDDGGHTIHGIFEAVALYVAPPHSTHSVPDADRPKPTLQMNCEPAQMAPVGHVFNWRRQMSFK